MLSKDLMSSAIEVVWLQVHMPHLKPIIVGVVIGHQMLTVSIYSNFRGWHEQVFVISTSQWVTIFCYFQVPVSSCWFHCQRRRLNIISMVTFKTIMIHIIVDAFMILASCGLPGLLKERSVGFPPLWYRIYYVFISISWHTQFANWNALLFNFTLEKHKTSSTYFRARFRNKWDLMMEHGWNDSGLYNLTTSEAPSTVNAHGN